MITDRSTLKTATLASAIVGMNAACMVLAPRYPELCFIAGAMINTWALITRLPIGQLVATPAAMEGEG